MECDNWWWVAECCAKMNTDQVFERIWGHGGFVVDAAVQYRISKRASKNNKNFANRTRQNKTNKKKKKQRRGCY